MTQMMGFELDTNDSKGIGQFGLRSDQLGGYGCWVIAVSVETKNAP